MKKLLILFMPFFMVCCKNIKQQGDTTVLLKRLLTEKKIDSLALVGERYKWTGKVAITDSGFKAYISTNYQIGDSIRLWAGRSSKKACPFFNNVVLYEQVLQSSTMQPLFLNALYKSTEPNFSYRYDEPVVTAFEKCRTYQQKYYSLDSSFYFDVLQSLGIAYHVLGEKEKSIRYYDEALALYLTAKNANKIASASINRFSHFIEYRKYNSVINSVPSVLTLSGIRLKRLATIKAYYAEALYEINNPTYNTQLQEAWDSLQRILANDMGADEWGKKSDILKLFGKIAHQGKRYNDAIHFYKRALDTCLKKNIANNDPPHERFYGKLLLCLADVHDSLGQYDSALYYSQFALACVTPVDSAHIASNPAPTDLYTENTIMEALDCKAGLLEKKYALTNDQAFLKNAITCYQRAFAVEQKLLDNFTYDSSRAEMQQVSKARSGRAIKACYQLYQLTGENIWAENAFQFSENSKALILLEAIKKNINKSLNKDNPLFKRVDSLQLQLAYTERELRTGKKEDAALMARKSMLETELNNALNELDNQELGYKKYRQLEDTAVLLALRKKLLTDNRYLAEFFCADSNRYLFVVKQTGSLVFTKLDSNIVPRIDSLMGFFAAKDKRDSKDYKQAAFQLFQSSGLAATLDAQELLLIPDGPLNQVPFDALVTSNSGNSGYQTMDYLFKKITASYGYSATSLLKQTDINETATGPIAAFAPVFAQGERKLPHLPNSEEEVKSIGATQPYLNNQATTDNLRKVFATAGIIHIASHASAGNGARAAIGGTSADTGANAEPRIEMYDTAFNMSELYATSLPRTHLVVLSACQTNQGNINQSEGTLSLARGFYYAGAKNIVASLWNVDDKSTTAIMKSFYGNGNGAHYAAKLNDAKRKFLNDPEASGRTKPYYWAALMHIGGFGQPKENNYWWIYVAGAVLLLLATGLLYKRRRKGRAKRASMIIPQ
jgi:LPXTG-motif cell wall-anchored protein